MIFSSINRIKDCIPYGDARKNDEAAGVQFFGNATPKIPQGLSPFSSACLYLSTHSSTPCAILANSLDSTFSCRYEIMSGGRETVNEIFLSVLDMKVRFLQSILNNFKDVALTSSNLLVGVASNDKNNRFSASSEDPGHHRGPDHELPRERLGPRPRGSVGFSPALPHAGTASESAGGDGHLRPQALAGPLGSGLRLSGVSA